MAEVTAPLRTANCCKCGRIIDTREKPEGGDSFGAQLADEVRWVCSPECWDAVVEPGALVSEPSCDDQLVEAERLAANLGYMVVPDPIHPDGEVHAPEFVHAMQPSLRALGFHAVPIKRVALIEAEEVVRVATAEIARVRALIDHERAERTKDAAEFYMMSAKCVALLARVAELEDALRPFAVRVPGYLPDDLWTACNSYEFDPTLMPGSLPEGASSPQLTLWLDGMPLSVFRRARSVLG